MSRRFAINKNNHRSLPPYRSHPTTTNLLLLRKKMTKNPNCTITFIGRRVSGT